MYLQNEKIKAYKNNSIKQIDKASVIIEQKEVLINSTPYDKRVKIFDKSGT
jgi:type II secretory pathway component PulC